MTENDKPRFTPGPWEVRDRNFGESWASIDICKGLQEDTAGRAQADWIAETDVMNVEGGYPVALANAHLISAAPDLYAACEAMTTSAVPNERDHPRLFAAWTQARAALAKARGRKLECDRGE